MSTETPTTTAPAAPPPAAPETPPAQPPAAKSATDDIMAQLAEVQAEREKATAKPPELAQPPPAEAAKPPEAPPAEPEKPAEEPVSSKERLALFQREQALAAREKELEGKAKLSEKDSAELAELRTLKQNAKADPIGYLEAGGLTAQEVFEAVKKGRAPMDPAAREALERAKGLEKKLAEQEAARAKAEEEAGLQRFRGAVADTITKGGEKYEFLAARGAAGVQDVQEAAIAYFQKHGRAPDLAKVAELVDKHYEQEFEATLKLKRAQGKLKPAASATAPAKPAEPAPTTTLTNGMDGKPPAAKPSAKSAQSYDEAILLDLEQIQKERGANG